MSLMSRKLDKELHPVIIRWDRGGNDVYFAFDGDGWSSKYRMKKSEKEFILIINLSPGIYHYKFIVDNQWRVNDADKWMKDSNGYPYNVLQVESSVAQKIREKQRKILVQKHLQKKCSYSQYIPNYDEQFGFEQPPQCPLHLYSKRWDTNDDDEKEDDYHKKRNGDAMIKSSTPCHVRLNHLYVLDKEEIEEEEEVVVMKLTERFKGKYVNTIYYKSAESMFA